MDDRWTIYVAVRFWPHTRKHYILISLFLNRSFKKLLGLLQSPHLDVRMAAGETLALVLECGRAHDEEFLEEYLNDLIDAVKQLATDSHKYRAKRDRKAQRATFRDVLRYLEVSFRLSNNEFIHI